MSDAVVFVFFVFTFSICLRLLTHELEDFFFFFFLGGGEVMSLLYFIFIVLLVKLGTRIEYDCT